MEVFLQNSNRQLNYQNYLVLLPFTSGANEEVRLMHSASIKLDEHWVIFSLQEWNKHIQ